ncbi:hypothetical protein RMT89_43675, partial [Streptomyces sp. P17]|nr:hypothetical protein [Streptomyces sp. P17]
PVHRLPPEWRDRPAPVAEPPRPIAATALGGAKVLAGGPVQEDAMAAGTRVHLLLEHLPHLPRGDWPEAARAALAGSELGLPESDTLTA